MRSWLYACHHSELRETGDFVLFELSGESVVITRTASGEIKAHMNVCRHRGSRVCLENSGNAKNLVCPYHGWAYDLDGKLLMAREMHKGFDKSQFGLKPVKVEVVFGMVFINFDPEAPDLTPRAEALSKPFKSFELDDTKVAYKGTWNVQANWKLAVENFMECYHCAPAHPEYAKLHSLKMPSRLSDKLKGPMQEKSEALGIEHNQIYSAGCENGDPLTDVFYSRHPLLDGYVTGSEDGKRVAPLLGNLSDYDGGAADFQIGPFCYGLIYCDHIVLYSFLPVSVRSTDMQIIWLVRDDAKEGTDYDPERLSWLWRVTTDADKKIILDNQLGVSSRFYEPGVYSQMEGHTQNFVEWYLQRISD